MKTLREFKQSLANYILRRRVQEKDFTIVSSDCWGSTVYRELKIQYKSPFIGIFMPPVCYLKVLRGLKEYLAQELAFVPVSRLNYVNEMRRNSSNTSPIGVLGEDVEIHFWHYDTEEQALQKWNSRRGRMNMDKLFIEHSDAYFFEEGYAEEFDRLPFAHKVMFTAHPYPEKKSVVWLPEYLERGRVPNLFNERHIYRRHFDVADWLNGGTGQPSFAYRAMNRLLELPPRQ